MSHTAETKSKIKQALPNIMKETLELMHKAEPSLRFETHFLDWSKNKISVDVGIFSPQLQRGLGVKFRNCDLAFIGDSYGAQTEYERIQKLLVSTYQALACQRAAVALGYRIDSTQSVGPARVLVQATQSA